MSDTALPPLGKIVMDASKILLAVNHKRISLAAFLKMAPDAAKYVDASGCTALTELKADAAKYVYAHGCTALTELKADAAETVYASGCTALTELKADAAKYVYARGCTALTELKADAAETVDASGCTVLTELKADAAETVDASGCTALTEPPHFEAGRDSRGYDFSAVKLHGQWRIIAGCRNFCLSDARKHWGSGGRSDRPDCAALVEKLALAIGG